MCGRSSKMCVYLYIVLFIVTFSWYSPFQSLTPLHTNAQIDNRIFHREVIGSIFHKHIKVDSLLCSGLFWKKKELLFCDAILSKALDWFPPLYFVTWVITSFTKYLLFLAPWGYHHGQLAWSNSPLGNKIKRPFYSPISLPSPISLLNRSLGGFIVKSKSQFLIFILLEPLCNICQYHFYFLNLSLWLLVLCIIFIFLICLWRLSFFAGCSMSIKCYDSPRIVLGSL